MKLFNTAAGLIVTDDRFSIKEHIQDRSQETTLLKKRKDIQKAPLEDYHKLLPQLKDQKFFPHFRENCISLSTALIRDSASEDLFIDHAINNIYELDKTANMLVKRLREWYALYLPEISRAIPDHEAFVQVILEKDKSALLKELKLDAAQSMGAELKKEHINEIILLAKHIKSIYELRNEHLAYLESVLKIYTPNLNELCGTTIAAKLIEHAGGLKRLALLPSSTVQLLGAEKALFRHLTRKSRPPKHGLIINHPFITAASKQNKGKASRALADKISMCARLDYFHGEFKAREYKKELEERFP